MATLRHIGGRLDPQNTGSTAATPSSPTSTVFDLRNWQHVKGNTDHAALKAAVDKVLSSTTTRKKKVQSEHNTRWSKSAP